MESAEISVGVFVNCRSFRIRQARKLHRPCLHLLSCASYEIPHGRFQRQSALVNQSIKWSDKGRISVNLPNYLLKDTSLIIQGNNQSYFNLYYPAQQQQSTDSTTVSTNCLNGAPAESAHPQTAPYTPWKSMVALQQWQVISALAPHRHLNFLLAPLRSNLR